MTTRTLIGLAAALVVLTVLAIYGQRSGESPGAAGEVDQVLLPELATSLATIDRVAVVGAGNEPVATLLRREERWVVAEKDDYPADIGKIREVLRALSEARVVERKTSNPDYYDRLGVSPVEEADSAGVAVAAYAGDEQVAAVVVGDAAGSGYHYVRPQQGDTSFMVDRELDVPRSVAEWVDPTIVDIRGARVREVVIEHPDGETLRVYKEDADEANFSVEGVPEGRELQYPGVANVIGNALRELRLEDVAAAGDGADDDAAVRTTYRTFDGLVVSVSAIGGEDGAWIELEARAEEQADGASDDAASDDAASDDAASDDVGSEDAEDEGATEAESGATTADGNAEPDGGAEPQSDGGADVSAEAEAAAINARVSGWRYRIPSYQSDQMSRRIEDLLQAEDTGGNE